MKGIPVDTDVSKRHVTRRPSEIQPGKKFHPGVRFF